MLKRMSARFIQRLFDVASRPVIGKTQALLRAEAKALFALSSIAPRGYVPWPRPSLSPVTLATTLNEIVVNSRRSVVELGSGLSTIFLARVLKDYGGTLWSVDQDPNWSRIVQDLAEREDVGHCLQMVVAPLALSSTSDFPGPWYDTSVLSKRCPPKGIDLLIVDGPGSDLEVPRIRYPARGFFSPRMSRACSVVIDDANRADERIDIQEWELEFGCPARIVGEAAYLCRGPGYLPIL